MEKSEITNDNKLIAKFMGTHNGESWLFPDNTVPDLGIYIYDEDLQFNLSWDWLMPVVEKIAKISLKDESIIQNGEDSYFDNYYLRTFAMINSETKEFMVRINRFPLHQSSKLIEATFESVVEFIKSLECGK